MLLVIPEQAGTTSKKPIDEPFLGGPVHRAGDVRQPKAEDSTATG